MRERIPAALCEAISQCIEGEAPWPLFVYGAPGTGKTCAGLYLCDRCLGRAMFVDFATLCSEFAAAKMRQLEWGISLVTEHDYWKRWANSAFCVIDEIGMRDSVNDHKYETLKRAIDTRYGKPLMVLSNLDLDAIGQLFDERISSRLAAGTECCVEGPDQRTAGR